MGKTSERDLLKPSNKNSASAKCRTCSGHLHPRLDCINSLSCRLKMSHQPIKEKEKEYRQVVKRDDEFPGVVKFDERHGRQLTATRDIEEGEVILKETPIVTGPCPNKVKFEQPKFALICLGCYKNVKGLYKCSKCGWPVCSAFCEKLSDHAEFECEVFASNPVSPITHSTEYEKIKILRCLLLREKNPEKWNRLLDLDPHEELRRGNFCVVSSTIALFKFITQECNLTIDVETFNHIVGVSNVSSFGTSGFLIPAPDTCTSKNASLIFDKSSLLTHDCVPNTSHIISETKDSFQITVIAATRIRKGELITHSFVNPTRGTFQRRSELMTNYYYSCKCKRCMDPSELCTFFSALKCPQPNCRSGHLLLGNPLSLEMDAMWICNYAPRCGFMIATSQVLDLLRDVRQEIERASASHSIFQEYENLTKIRDKYRGSILHPNHFLIMDIQYAIISCINKLLVLVNEEEALTLAVKQVELCKSVLSVADVLKPGTNRLRGNLLFYLQEGMLMIFLGEFKRKINEESFLVQGKGKFEDILKIMNEGRAILLLQPPGTKEHDRAKALTVDSSGLQSLIKYFSVKCD